MDHRGAEDIEKDRKKQAGYVAFSGRRFVTAKPGAVSRGHFPLKADWFFLVFSVPLWWIFSG
jgi:hypothetical protein